jgi:asparagine synthetase B (glutamine-hydrolysing)
VIAPLTPLEIASGVVIGVDDDAPRVPRGAAGHARTALEAAVLPALTRPPCVVSFSGGRDSSAVLAIATTVARAEGLPLPVAVTLRYAGAPDTQETEWQALVIGHLGLPDWQCIEVADELDLIGPVAQQALRRHGLLFPSNSHAHVPVLDLAHGGSLLTGVDGDGLLAGWIWADTAEALGRHRRPEPRDVLRLAKYAAPPPVRARLYSRRLHRPDTWLQADVATALVLAEAKELVEEPRAWRRWVPWWRRRRYLALTLDSCARLAADRGVVATHPFLDTAFLAALSAYGPRFGPGDRAAVMRQLFADALPDAVLDRETKAVFDEAFWQRHSRGFAEGWAGEGVDASLVDPARLRSTWLRPTPHPGTALLLQSAWLATQAG